MEVVTVLVDLGAGTMGQAVVLVLAQNPAPPADQGPEFGKASPIALVVTILLAIALVFLIRSMTKHLRRVPASFDPPVDQPHAEGSGPAGPDGDPDGTARPISEVPPER